MLSHARCPFFAGREGPGSLTGDEQSYRGSKNVRLRAPFQVWLARPVLLTVLIAVAGALSITSCTSTRTGPYVTQAGQEGWLVSTGLVQGAKCFLDADDLKFLLDGAGNLSGDQLQQAESYKIVRGAVIVLDTPVRVKVLEHELYKGRYEISQVSILEGQYQGKVGWLASQMVLKKKPE